MNRLIIMDFLSEKSMEKEPLALIELDQGVALAGVTTTSSAVIGPRNAFTLRRVGNPAPALKAATSQERYIFGAEPYIYQLPAMHRQGCL